MGWYLIRRIGSMLLSLWGVSVLIFLMVHLIPGNPARVMLGERATESAVRELEERLGLNEPLPTQYGRFITHALRFDFGKSIKTNRDVSSEIWSRFPATLELTLCAMAFAMVVGILLGVLAATRRGKLGDFFGMTTSLLGVSIPIYCLGLLMILLFAHWLGWFPNGGRYGAESPVQSVTGLMLIDTLLAGNGRAFLTAMSHLFLPSITLGTVPLAIISRMTRSSLLEALDQDYVRTARAKGLTPRVVVFTHALKNALIPVVTIIGLEFGYLLGGAVLTETIFSWPGLGRWLLLSVSARDMPAIQGGVLFVALLFMTVTLVVDLLYVVIDPRVRLEEG
ncbi:MAG: ABC transporter permease [Candidatus Poribacteria bacterium]|nr:ABC transporter permease [Candidatus Poribacteria bacterium]